MTDFKFINSGSCPRLQSLFEKYFETLDILRNTKTNNFSLDNMRAVV
jgi:hypothetical protein